MALKNKLINHIDKIKEIVLENELLKYAVKSLKTKLEEKNHNIQQIKVNHNTKNIKKQKQWWDGQPNQHKDYNTHHLKKENPPWDKQHNKETPRWDKQHNKETPLWDKQNNNDLNFKKYNNDLNFKTSSQQKKIVHFNPAPPQQFQRRNIRNFVKNIQTSLESQKQPPKQSHPKILIILKRKKFI